MLNWETVATSMLTSGGILFAAYKIWFQRRLEDHKLSLQNNGKLFLLFLEEPQCLPSRWFSLCDEPKTPMTARVVADYIAGMTDRAALSEYCKLFEVHETP